MSVTFLYSIEMVEEADIDPVSVAVESEIQETVTSKICRQDLTQQTMFVVASGPQDMQTEMSCGYLCSVFLGKITLKLDTQSFEETKRIYCETRAAIQDFFSEGNMKQIEGVANVELLDHSSGSLCD